MKIALIGSPNSGKSSLFNLLTKAQAKIGNWHGVTVEKKESALKKHPESTLIDLPGIYSLSAYSPEERLLKKLLTEEPPDLLLHVLDATSLEKQLYLTLQLLELGLPLILVLNYSDKLAPLGISLETKALSQALQAPLVLLSAKKKTGLAELEALLERNPKDLLPTPFPSTYEALLESCQKALPQTLPAQAFWARQLLLAPEKTLAELPLSSEEKESLKKSLKATPFPPNLTQCLIQERYEQIEELLRSVMTQRPKRAPFSQQLDSLLTHKYLAFPLFALIIWALYYLSLSSLGAMGGEFFNEVLIGQWIGENSTQFLTEQGAPAWILSFWQESILGGVGSVLSFLPQIFLLFFFLSLLENSGYMARVVFILDRVLRHWGLSGSSFIPLLMSSGCGVTGLMASRAIDQEAERKMTLAVTTFIPCGAKLPIIALIAAAFFPESSWVAPSIYFASLFAVALSARLLQKSSFFKASQSLFLMELPDYQTPSLLHALKDSALRVQSFAHKAGTVILLACTLLWFLSHFDTHLAWTNEISESWLALLGKGIAPLFSPLGFGSWQASVATFCGLLAKENVVATLGVLLGLGSWEESPTLLEGQIPQLFSPLAAYSFLLFNMLCAPCFAAMGALRRELGSLKTTLALLSFQTVFAYLCALTFYQLAHFITGEGSFHGLTLFALSLLLGALFLFLKRDKKA